MIKRILLSVAGLVVGRRVALGRFAAATGFGLQMIQVVGRFDAAICSGVPFVAKCLASRRAGRTTR